MVYVRKLEELKKYAKDNNIPIMQEDGIEFLKKYIVENNVKNILEIGSAIGYSAINMALAKNDVEVTTVERDEKRYNEAVNNIKKFNLQDRIDIVLADALEIDFDCKFDLIFIDAAKSQYIKLFERFKKNIDTKNGAIITDNLSFHGLVEDDSKTNNRNTKQLVKKIRNYIEYLKSIKDFKTTFLKIGDGISISIKQ